MWRHSYAAVLCCLIACTGEIGDPVGNNTLCFGRDCLEQEESCFGSQCEPGIEGLAPTTAFPRLTALQWRNSIRDLFYMDSTPNLRHPEDVTGGLFSNNVGPLQVSSLHQVDYQEAAYNIAEQVSSDRAQLDRILGGVSEDESGARQFIETFVARVYRRPLAEAETDRIVERYRSGAAYYPEQNAFTAGIRHIIEVVLQSPNFLYRVEVGGEAEDGAAPLNDYEIATRLSYALWNTMPSDALLDMAASGDLADEDDIATVAADMLDDSNHNIAELLNDAMGKLMHIEEILNLNKGYDEIFDLDNPTWPGDDCYEQGDPKACLNRKVGEAMEHEFERFIENELVTKNGGVAELMTSNDYFINKYNAPIYGLDPANYGDEFEIVAVPENERNGLLTLGGLLASKPRETQPIHRGVRIARNVLCARLGDPPDMFELNAAEGQTRREVIASQTSAEGCAACHETVINPLGFAFEHYGAMGKYREQDGASPVDASVTYRFPSGNEQTFADAVEFSEALAQSGEVHECLVQNMTELMFGRTIRGFDAVLITRIGEASKDNNLSIREILVEVVKSKAFRHRLIPEEGDQ